MQFDANVRYEADVANGNCRTDNPTRAVIRAVALQRAIALLHIARVIRVNHVLHRGMVVLLGHSGHRAVVVMRVRMAAAEAVRDRRGSGKLQRDREQQTNDDTVRVHAPSVVPAVPIFNTRHRGS
jgi:hypothetical protein